ncbi:YdeI/OmpD-associated family protein [Sphingomonas sp. SUN019]|uniref:YdeI/OmpD-associated family protein n=1 Tax=Sphingomonas sp. SUN019 TaxID=2937788 RepID=UPI002164877A|nr:YdeI/OmpD-associated family protein [Sphingomonas sp. SUN019]UVO51392.1 YdeI/OmpD-associated family protein [Sphingomonas sp. SUN019]
MTEERDGLPIRAFVDAANWEAWLAQQPRDSVGVWLKLAKSGNPEFSVTKPQAIDGALIHGWIDGQLNPYDALWWLIRFTPRKPRSKWSEKNRTRAIELIADGRIAAAGLREIDAAKADGRWDAAYAPQSTAAVPDDLAAALAATPGARAFFDALDGTNRYAILHRTADAKRPETRATRIAKFATMCAAGETIYPARSDRKKK